MNHGTIGAYTSGKCRCDDCRRAMTDYHREHRGGPADPTGWREAFADLLHELFPNGLTDDCPARRGGTAA